MRPAFVEEREEFALATPHLSYSRINRYLTCPEQYRLYYIENLRPRLAAASLVFGQIVHQALAHLFREQGDPLQFFLAEWNEARDFDLSYRQRESWEKLKLSGEALLERFLREDVKRIGNVNAAEKTFELRITSLDLPVSVHRNSAARIRSRDQREKNRGCHHGHAINSATHSRVHKCPRFCEIFQRLGRVRRDQPSICS